MAVLAFDVGHKRIGVAVGEALTGNARALPTLHPDDITHLDRLWRDWAPDAVVIGWPLTEDGQTQAATALAASFALQLQHRYGVAVYLCDERYSSRSADEGMITHSPSAATSSMTATITATDTTTRRGDTWRSVGIQRLCGMLDPPCPISSSPRRPTNASRTS